MVNVAEMGWYKHTNPFEIVDSGFTTTHVFSGVTQFARFEAVSRPDDVTQGML